jgi:serine/threonine-protein phosphatase 4 catalytic subunit
VGEYILEINQSVTRNRMNLDRWIDQLKNCECLKEHEVKKLCEKAIELLVEEANVQHVCSPVTICASYIL